MPTHPRIFFILRSLFIHVHLVIFSGIISNLFNSCSSVVQHLKNRTQAKEEGERNREYKAAAGIKDHVGTFKNVFIFYIIFFL